LFAAAQAGDPVALERMLRELQPDIRRYARRQCHRTTAIEDVVQEALIVLYRRLGTVRDPLALAGWILRVVTRLCMLPVLALIRGAEELTERHEAEYFAQVPKDELRIDVVRALESLPDMYREVILLRDMEQLTIGEVADRLRITREACKSRIHRGRALLREYLQGDESRGGRNELAARGREPPCNEPLPSWARRFSSWSPHVRWRGSFPGRSRVGNSSRRSLVWS
jgi:RNA polymerase sigma-70 factor (ECF subfamily)